VLALKPEAAKAKDAAGDAPAATYAQVDDKMRAARTRDQLDEAATLIAAVADAKQQEELNQTYQKLIAELEEQAAGQEAQA
jgi:hypothetical protein